MSNLTPEQLSKINFDDEDTICECGAYGVYQQKVISGDTYTADFICNNGHKFSKIYPLKEE